MDKVDAVRGKNRCFPRPPSSEKGGPNGCWYKAALNRLGYYTPQDGTGLTDDLDDADFQDALHAFQRQANIYFGDTDIGPGTTTERVLMDALAHTDESAAYIWRTASDDKVRDEHAMRAGKIYTWDAPPDGDHPGDDYNCRCWAEPLNPAQHPWAVWAREQAEKRRDQTVQGLAAPMGLNLDPILEAEHGSTIPAIAKAALTAVAVLITLRLGGRVPLGTIVKAIKNSKPLQAIRRETVDRRIYKRPDGIPKDWKAVSTAKGGGVVYKHPTKDGVYVKVQKADPTSSKPGQQYDNVRWQNDKKSFDVNGNIVKMNSKESHIPLKDFKFDGEKMK